MTVRGRPSLGERTSITLRLDPMVLEAVKRCAAQDLRSATGQMEVLLREALKARGYLRGGVDEMPEEDGEPGDG